MFDNPRTEVRYCALAISFNDAEGVERTSIMMANSRVIIFDTLEVARNYLPQLGDGRFTVWSADHETAEWTPPLIGQINKAAIITGWDLYNLPANAPHGLRSEAHGLEWHSHVMWSHVFTNCGQWALCSDGQYVNTAIGQEVY